MTRSAVREPEESATDEHLAGVTALSAAILTLRSVAPARPVRHARGQCWCACALPVCAAAGGVWLGRVWLGGVLLWTDPASPDSGSLSPDCASLDSGSPELSPAPETFLPQSLLAAADTTAPWWAPLPCAADRATDET